MPRSLQYIVVIPGELALQEIVARLAIGKGIDIHHDQSFNRIDHEGVVIDGMEGLLLIGHAHQLALIARGGDRLIGRQRHAGGIAAADVRVMSQRRKGC